MTAPLGNHYYYDQYGIEDPAAPGGSPAEDSLPDDYQDFDQVGFGVEPDDYLPPEGDEGPEAGGSAGAEEALAAEEDEATDTGADSEFAAELAQFKKQVEASENLTPEQRAEYVQKLEQWSDALDLGQGDPEAMAEEFETLQETFQETSQYSPVAVALAQAAEGDPEDVEAKAKAAGIDLKHPPSPPNQAMLEFLAEVSPALADQLGRVQEAIRTRSGKIEETEAACRAQNAANTACSSDGDNTDLSNFQLLYDLEYHQDQWSRDVASAASDANATLVGLLKSVYPEASVSASAAAEGAGWETAHQSYLAADKIDFNGTTLDFLDANTGEVRAGAADSESGVELIAIKYDWEGSGDWEDGAGRPHVNNYGADQVNTSTYDN